MFFKRKEKMYLGQFLHAYTQSLLKSNIDLPEIKEISKPEEQRVFNEEVKILRCVMTMFLLMEKRRFGSKDFDAEGIGYSLSQALVLSYMDLGHDKREAVDLVEDVNNRVGNYVDYIDKMEKKDTAFEQRGVYFYLLCAFAEILSHGDKSKNFTYFDFANQVYKNDVKALEKALNKTEFIDE